MRTIITDAEIIAGWTGRDSARLLADDYHISRLTVLNRARKLGLVTAITKPVIDNDRLRNLWRQDIKIEAIASLMGVNPTSVVTRARFLNLPLRGRGRRPAAVPVIETPAVVPDLSLTGRLIASKGKWSALAEIAAVQGWTTAKAQQEFHRARAG